jgi:hypothetical protein
MRLERIIVKQRPRYPKVDSAYCDARGIYE